MIEELLKRPTRPNQNEKTSKSVKDESGQIILRINNKQVPKWLIYKKIEISEAKERLTKMRESGSINKRYIRQYESGLAWEIKKYQRLSKRYIR
tara:strand:+ start:1374 stop:1655 length:282 start_codon:yes stop_codon:yes gene_type:complete